MAAPPPPLDPTTLAVTAGRPRAPGAGLNPPVVLASTYHPGGPALYARDHNPTWTGLEDALGALETGTATVFASGMGAITAVLDTLAPGARVVAADDLYTLTGVHLEVLAEAGRIALTRVDATDTDAVLAACHGADLLWLESPTNPLLQICDLPASIGEPPPAACAWSSTTPSPRRCCSARSSSAPPWSSTARRSTSRATPTSCSARP